MSRGPHRHVRVDALPEHSPYVDSGCDYHPACLTCPFVVCRYDVAGGLHRLSTRTRAARVVALVGGGVSIDAVASEVRLTRRSVYRILRAARE